MIKSRFCAFYNLKIIHLNREPTPVKIILSQLNPIMQKTTVFLIDDDVDDQEIFLFILSDVCPQADCVFANDGLFALEKLQDISFNPSIIFIDINMPRMNGLEILKEIKQIKRLSQIPVYMYSTSNESAIVEQSRLLGATSFIKKHIDTDVAKAEFQQIIAKLKL